MPRIVELVYGRTDHPATTRAERLYELVRKHCLAGTVNPINTDTHGMTTADRGDHVRQFGYHPTSFHHYPVIDGHALDPTPITSKSRNIPLPIALDPPEGGLKLTSYAMPEMIRSIAVRRLARRLGTVSPARILLIEAHVRALLNLG